MANLIIFLSWLIVMVFIITGITYIWGGITLAPWVPMRKKDRQRMFDLAKLQPGKTFYELGSGTGTLVLAAAKQYKANGRGVEIVFPLWLISRIRQSFYHSHNVKFVWGDLFKQDISGADVLYVFGMPVKLKERFVNKVTKQGKSGVLLISYVFKIDGLEPVHVSKPTENDLPIYVYQIN